jgi:FkbM family methyltransferase
MKPIYRAAHAVCRAALGPIVPLLPDAVINRVPFVGEVSVPLPNSKRLRLVSDCKAGKVRIARTVCREGLEGYESATMRVYLQALSHAKVVLDIGANMGLYSLVAAALDHARQVFAFEPVPEVAEVLECNVHKNRLFNLSVQRVAVTDHSGKLKLYVRTDTSSLPTDSSAVEGFRANVREITVPAITVEQFVADQGIGRIDLMKIDTEATEPQVLRGAMSVIRRDKPVIICEVLAGRTEPQLQALLEGTGYRYFHIAPQGLVEKQRIEGDGASGHRDYVFVADASLVHVWTNAPPRRTIAA